ncbi:MAG: Crp/Fnr family transcriptional regulator [Nitrospinota bacterium]|nr:Crp/Fnr family transcriptional regulator [Nitrospinota bacterium]
MIKPSDLKTIKALKGLTDAEMEDVGRSFVPLNLKKGEYLFYRKDPGSAVYFLAKGALQITIDNEENKEIVVYVIQEGDIVGEMSLFSHAARSATAAALEKCLFYKVDGDKFLNLMSLYPIIAINLARTLVDRLMEANAIIERLGTMDGSQRVANFIKAMAIRSGELQGEFYRIRKKPTYRNVSQRLGMSEKTVYRAMHGLMEHGDVSVLDGMLLVKKVFVDQNN